MSFISKIKNKFQTTSKQTKLSQVQKEIYKGNFSRAKEYLEEFEKLPDNSEEDIIISQIFDIYITTNQGNPAKGLEIADKVITNFESENSLLLIESYVAKAYALFDLNKLPECSEALESGKSKLKNQTMSNRDDLKELNGKIHYLQARIFRKNKDIVKSLEELNKALNYRKDLENLDGLGDIYAELGLLNFMMGNPDSAISSLLEGIEIFKKLNSKTKLLKAYNNIGLIYSNLQNVDKSLEYYLLSLKILEEFGDQFKPNLGILSLNIGVFYIDKGEIDIALTYLERARQIFSELDAKDQVAYAINAISVVYEMKGDLQVALDMYNESLVIFEQLKIEKEMGNTYNNIGNIYVTKGELSQAISYFEKSLKIFENIKDAVQISGVLYNLIGACVAIGNLDEANLYLNQLGQHLNSSENKLIDQIYRLSKANILKKSKRIIKKAEAQLIFQQVSYEDVIKHQNTVDSMFNLCEMLIQELRSSGNEAIIIEVKDVITKLIEIAQNQNSFRVLVQSKLLQSKIALLELDLTSAQKSLNEAQTIAFEKGLDNLAMVISGEYDALISQLSKWTDLIDSNVSMIERLEMAELEGMVSNMVRKKADNPELLEEIPELFLVLNDQGMKIFSKVFTAESTLDDQVVGDLLTAVNSFIQETFSASGSIERLKHKEHTLMLKPFDNYLTCYVFKGQSYTALQKLEKFILSVKEQEDMYQNVINAKDEIVDENFNSLVSNIFTAKVSAQ
jgi:tetratricopeptide (TPR) repeat protein